MSNELQQLPPDRVAFVIDGEVVEVLYVNERLAAILNSNPLIVDVTGMTVDVGGIVQRGILYDVETNTFKLKEESK
jgi:hypothetical protein